MADPLDQCQAYFDAWNAHDADAIVATFSDTGWYTDPAAGQPLMGARLVAYVQDLWSAFPDLKFEIRAQGRLSEDTVAAEWVMRGANTGSFRGLPPTAKPIELAGFDVITLSDAGIESVTGYFDTAALPRQLGLQVVVQPYTIGAFEFGTSTGLHSGKTHRPGAFSVTQLHARSNDEVEAVKDLSRRIAQDMLSMDGFISLATMTVGQRMMTVTAWERPEQVSAIYRNSIHREAMQKFFGEDLASAGMVSSLIPQHVSRTLRCTECGTMSRVDDKDDSNTCACGAALPDSIPWW